MFNILGTEHVWVAEGEFVSPDNLEQIFSLNGPKRTLVRQELLADPFF